MKSDTVTRAELISKAIKIPVVYREYMPKQELWHEEEVQRKALLLMGWTTFKEKKNLIATAYKLAKGLKPFANKFPNINKIRNRDKIR